MRLHSHTGRIIRSVQTILMQPLTDPIVRDTERHRDLPIAVELSLLHSSPTAMLILTFRTSQQLQ